MPAAGTGRHPQVVNTGWVVLKPLFYPKHGSIPFTMVYKAMTAFGLGVEGIIVSLFTRLQPARSLF